MALSAAQKRANDKYIKENYEFIKVRMRKGDREKIKKLAEAAGKSVNKYIMDAILPEE